MPTLGVCLSLVGALSATPPPPPAALTAPVAAQASAQAGPAPRHDRVFVATQAFTLAWTHSIERVRWEEDYRVQIDPVTGLPRLHAVAARIKGSGAGMEPPPDAVPRGGWYHYTPTIPYPQELRLTRSEFTPDYDWCVQGQCQTMTHFIASNAGITRAAACFYP